MYLRSWRYCHHEEVVGKVVIRIHKPQLLKANASLQRVGLYTKNDLRGLRKVPEFLIV
jgi:hypothetical protein